MWFIGLWTRTFRPHYNLDLQSISVNRQMLPIDPAVFATSDNQGTIVDTGTTLTYLVAEAFEPFVNAVSFSFFYVIWLCGQMSRFFQHLGSFIDGLRLSITYLVTEYHLKMLAYTTLLKATLLSHLPNPVRPKPVTQAARLTHLASKLFFSKSDWFDFFNYHFWLDAN